MELEENNEMIRKALSSDAEGIFALIDSNTDHLLPRTLEEIRDLIPSFIVALEGDTIVGCVCCEVYSPKIAEIRSLAVSSTYRGKGLGTRLVKIASEEAKNAKVKEVLVVTSSPDFFEPLGFKSCLNEKYVLFWMP